jgi:hypothetical protein
MAARLISAISKMLGLPERLGVDGDHEAQSRALVLGRQLAHSTLNG